MKCKFILISNESNLIFTLLKRVIQTFAKSFEIFKIQTLIMNQKNNLIRKVKHA